MAKKKIQNYTFYPGIGLNDAVHPNAKWLLNANKTFIQYEVSAWIAKQVADNASGFEGYTYDDAKCRRDTGYNIDAWLHDLQYGGNEETYRIAGMMITCRSLSLLFDSDSTIFTIFPSKYGVMDPSKAKTVIIEKIPNNFYKIDLY